MKHLAIALLGLYSTSMLGLAPTHNRLAETLNEINSINPIEHHLPETATPMVTLGRGAEQRISNMLKTPLVEVLSAGSYTERDVHIGDVKNAINALNRYLGSLGETPVSINSITDYKDMDDNLAQEMLLQIMAQTMETKPSSQEETLIEANEEKLTEEQQKQAQEHGMPAPIEIAK